MILSLSFPSPNTVCAFTPLRATLSVHLIVLGFVSKVLFGTKYRSWLWYNLQICLRGCRPVLSYSSDERWYQTEREWMRTFEARLSTLYATNTPELRSCVLTRGIPFISLFGEITELASFQMDLFWFWIRNLCFICTTKAKVLCRSSCDDVWGKTR